MSMKLQHIKIFEDVILDLVLLPYHSCRFESPPVEYKLDHTNTIYIPPRISKPKVRT